MQIVEDAGRFKFAMSLLTAQGQESQPLEFEMKLPYMDHRAFTTGSGSLPLHQPEWHAISSKA